MVVIGQSIITVYNSYDYVNNKSVKQGFKLNLLQEEMQILA